MPNEPSKSHLHYKKSIDEIVKTDISSAKASLRRIGKHLKSHESSISHSLFFTTHRIRIFYVGRGSHRRPIIIFRMGRKRVVKRSSINSIKTSGRWVLPSDLSAFSTRSRNGRWVVRRQMINELAAKVKSIIDDYLTMLSTLILSPPCCLENHCWVFQVFKWQDKAHFFDHQRGDYTNSCWPIDWDDWNHRRFEQESVEQCSRISEDNTVGIVEGSEEEDEVAKIPKNCALNEKWSCCSCSCNHKVSSSLSFFAFFLEKSREHRHLFTFTEFSV